MKTTLLSCLTILLILTTSFSTFAQSNITSSGDWDNSGIWSSGIPSGTSSDATWNTNKTVAFPNSTAYSTTSTIGNMTMNNSDVLTIGDGTATNVKLILGASGTAKDLTVNNSATITVKNGGTLEIWGNVIINNHLTLDVQTGGTLTIHGNLQVANSANVDVSGNVTVGGNFSIGNSGQVTVNSGGSVAVTGNVTSGSATCAVVNGTFTTGGSCTDSGTSNNCGGTTQTFCQALPITLSTFKAFVSDNLVNLKWSTSSEINFDHFVLERSLNGAQFSELAKIKGSGFSNTRKDYSYTDQNPFVGNSYYRLTSVDFDNYTEVFNNNVVRVTVNAGKNFYIAPNPIEGLSLKAGINFDASNTHVVIYDRMGSAIGHYNASGSEFELQLPNLPNGVYFAQIQSDGFTKSVRFAVNQ